MTDVVTSSLQVDLKRRTTLPGDILAAAGIPAGSALVVRVEEPGRIVLESPALLLAQLQDDIAAALAGPGGRDGDAGGLATGQSDDSGGAASPTRDLVAELLAERAADTSLTTDHDDQQAEAPPQSPDEDGPSHSRHSGDGFAAGDAPGDVSTDLPHLRGGAA